MKTVFKGLLALSALTLAACASTPQPLPRATAAPETVRISMEVSALDNGLTWNQIDVIEAVAAEYDNGIGLFQRNPFGHRAEFVRCRFLRARSIRDQQGQAVELGHLSVILPLRAGHARRLRRATYGRPSHLATHSKY